MLAAGLLLAACKSTQAPTPTPAKNDGRAPNWEVKAKVQRATVAGDTVIAQTDEDVRAFDRRTGAERWRFDLYGGGPRSQSQSYADVYVADGVLVVEMDSTVSLARWVYVHDLATGKLLWERGADSVATFFDAVYTTDCSKPCSPSSSFRCDADPCPLSRRELRTGREKWTILVSGSPGVVKSKLGPSGVGFLVAPKPGTHLILLTGAKGKYRTSVMDPLTGSLLASIDGNVAPRTTITDRTLVHFTPESRGCKQVLQGVDTRSGETRWQTEIHTRVSGSGADGKACPGQLAPSDGAHDMLGVPPATLFSTDAGNRPIAVDLDTGVVRWRGATAAVPVDGNERIVLVRDVTDISIPMRDRREKGALAALDASSGKRLWLRPAGSSPARHAVLGDAVLEDPEGESVTVLDTKTGAERWRALPGSLIGAGLGWFVVAQDEVLRYYAL